jgi:hypothetical protein
MVSGAPNEIIFFLHLMTPLTNRRTEHWAFPRTAQELAFKERLSLYNHHLSFSPNIHEKNKSLPYS